MVAVAISRSAETLMPDQRIITMTRACVASRRSKKNGLPKRELRKAKDPAARGWVSQAARAAGAAGEFGRPSIQVNDPIINSAVA